MHTVQCSVLVCVLDWLQVSLLGRLQADVLATLQVFAAHDTGYCNSFVESIFKIMSLSKQRKVAAVTLLIALDAERNKKRPNNKKRALWAREWLLRRDQTQGTLAMLFRELG